MCRSQGTSAAMRGGRRLSVSVSVYRPSASGKRAPSTHMAPAACCPSCQGHAGMDVGRAADCICVIHILWATPCRQSLADPKQVCKRRCCLPPADAGPPPRPQRLLADAPPSSIHHSDGLMHVRCDSSGHSACRTPQIAHADARCEVAFVGRAAGLTCRSSVHNRVCKPAASPASEEGEGEAGTACSPSAGLYRVTIAATVSSQHGDPCLDGRWREQRSQQR